MLGAIADATAPSANFLRSALRCILYDPSLELKRDIIALVEFFDTQYFGMGMLLIVMVQTYLSGQVCQTPRFMTVV